VRGRNHIEGQERSRVVECCSMLQCAAMCCSALQRVAACGSVWQRVVVRCGVLRCVAVCCSVLRCVAACCNVLQCVAVYSMIQYVAVCCSMLQCVAVCCNVLQCGQETTSESKKGCCVSGSLPVHSVCVRERVRFSCLCHGVCESERDVVLRERAFAWHSRCVCMRACECVRFYYFRRVVRE